MRLVFCKLYDKGNTDLPNCWEPALYFELKLGKKNNQILKNFKKSAFSKCFLNNILYFLIMLRSCAVQYP